MHIWRLIVVLAATLLATGCIRRFAISQVGNALSSGTGSAFESDEDIELVGAALPFGLKLMESLLADVPELAIDAGLAPHVVGHAPQLAQLHHGLTGDLRQPPSEDQDGEHGDDQRLGEAQVADEGRHGFECSRPRRKATSPGSSASASTRAGNEMCQQPASPSNRQDVWPGAPIAPAHRYQSRPGRAMTSSGRTLTDKAQT